jgi:hypothetical protein
MLATKGAALQEGASAYVRFFSNRPFRVKRFQTIHDCSVDVAHGLVLLFGIGTKALPSWGSRRGGTIFGSALPLDER